MGYTGGRWSAGGVGGQAAGDGIGGVGHSGRVGKSVGGVLGHGGGDEVAHREGAVEPDAEDADLLGGAYEFLRRVETVLRRWRNSSASSLPPDPLERRKLAIRMGFEEAEAWLQVYERARADIHAIYRKYFVA